MLVQPLPQLLCPESGLIGEQFVERVWIGQVQQEDHCCGVGRLAGISECARQPR